MKQMYANEQEPSTHYEILIRNTVCLQRVKVMSVRRYFGHTVVLPEEDRFTRAE